MFVIREFSELTTWKSIEKVAKTLKLNTILSEHEANLIMISLQLIKLQKTVGLLSIYVVTFNKLKFFKRNSDSI